MKPLDYSLVPLEFQKIIKLMLSINPMERPSTSELYFLINHKELLPKKNINYNQPIESVPTFIISRISQILDTNCCHILNSLQKNEPHISKLLYYLFTEREEVHSHLSKDNRTKTWPKSICSLISHENIIIKKYSADSSDVLKAVKDYLISINGCLSNPTIQNRTLVLNDINSNQIVSFECFNSEEEEKCEVSLFGNPSSAPLLHSLNEHLNNLFID